ncbi:hypothetical protein GGF37_001385 [Kickxella alabastrina]|nr:hypothetical protein GGF37_001385 [Kickxella alabastrina]
MKKSVNEARGVDIDYLSKLKREYSRITDTDHFKSIRILLEYCQQHSILDDIESLLYAMLAIFEYISFWEIRMPQSQIRAGIPELPATLKVGGMTDIATYPEHFGICSTIPSKVRTLLDPLRRLLFSKNNYFIGGFLLSSSWEVRKGRDNQILFLYGTADNNEDNNKNNDEDDGSEDHKSGDNNCTNAKPATAAVVEPAAHIATTATDITKPTACANPVATAGSTSAFPIEQPSTPTSSCESSPTHSSERSSSPVSTIKVIKVFNKYIVNGASKRKRQPNEDGTLDTEPRMQKLRKL